MSNTFATLPVMAGDDVPAGPVDPIFNRLLKDRIIWMGEEVKDDMANRICAQLLMLAAEDPKKDIWLYINSPAAPSPPAWPSTTPCSSSSLTWRPWAWACVLPWASSC